MAITSAEKQTYGQSNHELTEEGKKEIKRFVWLFAILWILSTSIKNLMDSGDITIDPWLTLLVDSLIRLFIAFTIIGWVNKEVRFFEQTEWYKAKQADNKNPNSFELTEGGKITVKKFIKIGVLIYLLQYFSTKLLTPDLIDWEPPLIITVFQGFSVMIFILYTIYYFDKNKKILFNQNPKTSSESHYNTDQRDAQTPNTDIFNSNPQKVDKPKSTFTSSSNKSNDTCKNCYGGLNEQGKCNQCDVKW